MRTIKFRGQRVDNSEWVEGYYWWNCLTNSHSITVSEPGADNFFNYDVKPETVGRFTGLKDSEGAEIYEGDRLMYCSNSSQSDADVEYQNGCFVGVGPFNTHPLTMYLNSPDMVSLTIIGTRFDLKT